MNKLSLVAPLTLVLSIPLAAATHVVRVNADGTFSPPTLSIANGDTVEWQFASTTDSIIPVDWDGRTANYCAAIRPYSAADPNEFTGPMAEAASGIFTISSLDAGFVVEPAKATCSNGLPPKITIGSEMLCRGTVPQATLESTWADPSLSGVFIRLLWKEVQTAPGTADSSFDFTALDREIDKAVKNGKVYSLGIKAGSDGTPDWLFTNGVTRVALQDSGTGDEGGETCGAKMNLGNPTEIAYQNRYFDLLRKVAAHLRSRADRYRALAYIKPSGANLFTHENRLPKRCMAGCICNPQVWAQNGYTPSGLYAFYQAQTDLLAAEFPRKTMSYGLIQDGFPRVSDSGAYEKSDGTSSGGALPGATEQTQRILDNGQAAYGLEFAVQHNGLNVKRTDGCLQDVKAAGCPNRWVLQEGLEGQVTGWQTTNDLASAAEVDSALQNALVNSQGVFVELYEENFWAAVHQPNGVVDPAGSGRTMTQWATEFRNRRLSLFPTIANPFPLTHRHTFVRTQASGDQVFHYVHGAKCSSVGTIVIAGTAPDSSRRRSVRH
jgi:hypothetical protein